MNDKGHFTVNLLWPASESGHETTRRQLPSVWSRTSLYKLDKLRAHRLQKESAFIRGGAGSTGRVKRDEKKTDFARVAEDAQREFPKEEEGKES
jgi:hypothetical protein